ncbi:MAG: hypothetical protein CMG57_09130 [Candidatus Marinimicrobia bacterium]|nr:hypothetical protein [Candidatus Neomarinimicrobiota bacterium]|tara:strand:- start:12071 stop:12466 length:396 start_codon:yes stop_codon:yes gene_type:complete
MYRKGEKINFEITQNEAIFINDRITLQTSRNSNLGEGISVNLEFIKKISKVICRTDKSSRLCSININWNELLILREICLSFVRTENELIGKNLSIKVSRCIINFKKLLTKNIKISSKVENQCKNILKNSGF